MADIFKTLEAKQYFDILKSKKVEATDETLNGIYDNCLTLLNKYRLTNQKAGMRKLLFHLDNIERERELIRLGINTFVYKSDIEDYIAHVSSKVVKIALLEDYTREIPDDAALKIAKVQSLFDKVYIIFTDYTGESERRVAANEREADPIVFGTFESRENRVIVERFYFIADWEDEYCDLTLDKLLADTKKKLKRDIKVTIKTPEDLRELKKQLGMLKEVNLEGGESFMIKK